MSVSSSTTLVPNRSNVIVELSLGSPSPMPALPDDLKDHVSPETWADRTSTLIQLASQYYHPTFERAYLVTTVVLSFLVPVMTYYVVLHVLENTRTMADDVDRQVWLARFSSIAATLATWIILIVPLVLWKYSGKIRLMRSAEEWTKTDALAAHSYGDAPIWKASAPGMFRGVIVLVVTVLSTKQSHFNRDSCLPPYIAASDDALPAYQNLNTADWSRDPKGGVRYGDLLIYNDGKSSLVQV